MPSRKTKELPIQQDPYLDISHSQPPIQQERNIGLRNLATYIAEIITIAGALVYSSGFVIVNAYLSQKGVSNVKLLHPAFVPAGLLFMILTIWTSGISISGLYLVMRWPFGGREPNTTPPSQPQEHLEKEMLASDLPVKVSRGFRHQAQHALYKQFARIQRLRPLSYLPRLIIAILLIILSGFLLAYMLAVASPQEEINSIDLANNVLVITLLQGICTGLIAINFYVRDQIRTKQQIHIPVMSGLVVILVQLYCLLYFAGNIYGDISPSVGGGAPDKVILYVTESNKPYFNALAIDFCPLTAEQDGKPIYASSNIVWLFWQFAEERRFGTSGDAPTGILYVSTDITTEPIIAVQGEKILAMTFLTRQYQVC